MGNVSPFEWKYLDRRDHKERLTVQSHRSEQKASVILRGDYKEVEAQVEEVLGVVP